MAIIPTGVILGMPPQMYCRIVGRSSSLIKRGLMTYEGVIDSGFRGQLFVIVWNFPKGTVSNPSMLPINATALSTQRTVTVKRGDAIAQVIFHQNTDPMLFKVNKVSGLRPSERGTSGFGSSGVDASNGGKNE
jgi:dUTPase